MIRGRWVFDKTMMQLVPAEDYYARKYGDIQSSDPA